MTDNAVLFDQIYAEHHRVLYAFLLGQCGEAETATDLLQETFLRAWQHIADLQRIPADRRRFYLFATARNLLRDTLRRRQVRERYTSPAYAAERATMGAGDDPTQTLLKKEMAMATANAIHALPTELRTILSLKVVAEMTSAEIGKALDIPDSTVRYRLAEARRRLALALEKGGIPG